MDNLQALVSVDLDLLTTIEEEVELKLSNIEGVVYDIDSISIAKQDKAELNKLAKALNQKRIDIEKAFMQPFIEFKGKVKSITDRIKEVSNGVDLQVKAVEQKEKEIRIENVLDIFIVELNKFDFDITIDKILNEKWYNKISDKEISNGIQHALMVIENDLKVITTLNSEFQEELINHFLKDLNLPITIEYKATLERAKEVAQAKVKKIEVVASPSEFDFGTPKVYEKEQEYVITMKCTKSAFENVQNILKSNNIKFMV
jgi:hypothetical protein